MQGTVKFLSTEECEDQGQDLEGLMSMYFWPGETAREKLLSYSPVLTVKGSWRECGHAVLGLSFVLTEFKWEYSA